LSGDFGTLRNEGLVAGCRKRAILRLTSNYSHRNESQRKEKKKEIICANAEEGLAVRTVKLMTWQTRKMHTDMIDCNLCITNRVLVGSPCPHKRSEGTHCLKPKKNQPLKTVDNIAVTVLTLYKPSRPPPGYKIPHIIPQLMDTDEQSPLPGPSDTSLPSICYNKEGDGESIPMQGVITSSGLRLTTTFLAKILPSISSTTGFTNPSFPSG
jgi:hypothetical protein